MKRNSFIYFFILPLFFSLFLFTGCSDHDPAEDEPEETVKWEVLHEFKLADLKKLQITNSLPDLTSVLTEQAGTDETLVTAVKISCLSGHPAGTNQQIHLSGVALFPRKTTGSSSVHKQIIAPPFTYTLNADAPSVQFSADDILTSLKNYLAYWTIVSSGGFVVIIPDYPGFGDSIGECFLPYVEARPMTRTLLDLMAATESVATENGYVLNKELLICGYSQGAFVAAFLCRELENNASHGYTVDLLMTGGTPANLRLIADRAKASATYSPAYFLPYAIWGYLRNGYPEIIIKDLLLEPYATVSEQYFDGFHTDIDHLFPEETAALYTSSFLTNDTTRSSIRRINEILDENSLNPWPNKCKFVMIHGTSDPSVYYENAKTFADMQNATGGMVSLVSVPGDHGSTGTVFFTLMLPYLIDRK